MAAPLQEAADNVLIACRRCADVVLLCVKTKSSLLHEVVAAAEVPVTTRPRGYVYTATIVAR